QRHEAGVAALRKGVVGGHGREERLQKPNGLAIEGVGRVGAHELDRPGGVVGVAGQRRGTDEGWIRYGYGEGAEAGRWQKAVLKQIERANTLIAALREGPPLEDLGAAAGVDELTTDREAEGADTAAAREEIPERVAVDAELRL